MLFVLFGIGLIAVVFEIGQDRAFDSGGGEVVGAKLFVQRERDAVDALRFQRPDDYADQFAKLGRIEALTFATAREHQALGAEAGRAMQDRHFTGFAGELAGVIELLDWFRCRTLGRRALKSDDHHRV